MPPTTEQRVREEVKTEFSIGEQVIFQASQDGRVEYGEIIASKVWLTKTLRLISRKI